jgi:NitT/TauT family transport system permease protein
MADQLVTKPAPQHARPARGIRPWMTVIFRDLVALRQETPLWQQLGLGALSIVLCFGLWWFVTLGEGDERLVPYYTLPSPAETFASFPNLWVERELTWNTLATLQRLVLGFGLAAVVGVPLGVLCGCFPRLYAFFTPVMIFGRNIPVAALIGLTMVVFGIGEEQKVMFLFIACVAFVISDSARAILEVGEPYVDTALTLGARRWQVILKVLVPLAMPSIFNSLRLLFGLAFGYIMLAELVKTAGQFGGLGYIINTSERRGPHEHIFLVLLIIPLVALAMDRLLFWIQRQLFPHRYGGPGLLKEGLRLLLYRWEDLKRLVWKPAPIHLDLPQTAEPSGGKP